MLCHLNLVTAPYSGWGCTTTHYLDHFVSTENGDSNITSLCMNIVVHVAVYLFVLSNAVKLVIFMLGKFHDIDAKMAYSWGYELTSDCLTL